MSKIEWTERTWNPIVSGCSIISEGCSNCYAMKMARRLEFMGQEKYKDITTKTKSGNIIWNNKIKIDLDDKALFEPLRRKKSTMYFVNSMTDLFHKDVPFNVIDKIMSVIAACPQHTFQILTKRADRMYEYFETQKKKQDIDFGKFISDYPKTFSYEKIGENYILSNLWLGVSVENQEQVWRIEELLKINAAVRFISLEPLLSNIDLKLIYEDDCGCTKPSPLCSDCMNTRMMPKYKDIHWVIVGGESGKNARPMHPDWVRSIQKQCEEANIPFFFKQWGGKNKKQAGRLLDGKEYNEMPKI